MTFRLYPDPADQCVSCAGRGYRKLFDADCGYDYHACLACLGHATAGHFLVRVVVGDCGIDASLPLAGFEAARQWALGLAEQVRLRGAVYARRAEVRVEYLPHDEEEYRETVLVLGAAGPAGQRVRHPPGGSA